MKKSTSSTVIWDSSLPYPTSRSTPTNQSKSHLISSPSLRVLRTFQSSEASEERYPLLEHLYSPLAHRRKLQRKQTQVLYSVKYVGVCNGEMGVLSQRKVLLSERQKKTSDLPLLGNSLPALDAVPQEFLQPAPERYAEYLVHTYTRPRPLTPSKAPTFTPIQPDRFYTALQDIEPAQIPRRGISGWKLTSPKRTVQPRPKPVRLSPPPPQSPLLCSIQTGERQRKEAYLQYLRLRGLLKD